MPHCSNIPEASYKLADNLGLPLADGIILQELDTQSLGQSSSYPMLKSEMHVSYLSHV